MKVETVHRRSAPIFVLATIGLMVISASCTSSTKPGNLQRVQPVSDHPRAGNAYLLRGWLGIFSAGMDNLTVQIDKRGVRASVYQDDQWSALARRLREEYLATDDHEPLVLIGHSYGADDIIRVARELDEAGIRVDLLITLDAVTPPLIPGNVSRCVNIYRSNGTWDALPWFRGVPVQTEERFAGQLENFDIRSNRPDLLEPGTDHFNIEKKQAIHNEIIREVLAACPPRQTWLASRGRIPRGVDQAVPAGAVMKPAAPAKPPVRSVVVGDEHPERRLGN